MRPPEEDERRPAGGGVQTKAPASATSYRSVEDVSGRRGILGLSNERDLYLRRILAAYRDGYAAARDVAYSQGFIAGVASIKRQIRNEVDDLRTETARWHVCCRACRRTPAGKRACVRGDCRDCHVRTRETFGLPHPDDYPPGSAPNTTSPASTAPPRSTRCCPG